jgi:uncharacterized protein (DUF1501 family)
VAQVLCQNGTDHFRSTYATILDKWLGLDPQPIVHGNFEQFAFV